MSLNDSPDANWTGEFRLAPKTDDSDNKVGGGVIFPSFTTTERDALTDVAAGTVIYNSTTAKLNVYTTAWEAVTSS